MSGSIPGTGSDPVPDDSRATFARAPLPSRVVCVLCLVVALVLPFALSPWGQQDSRYSLMGTLVALLLVSVLNTELAVRMKGGLTAAHERLDVPSAWSLGSALLLPLPYLPLVVALTFGYASRRSPRAGPWAWSVLAAFTTLSATAAAVVARAVKGEDPNWMYGDGGRGLVAVVLAAAAFLLVTTLLRLLVSRLGVGEVELQLRRTLRSAWFYATEACVLLVAGLLSAVWTAGWWFTLLLVPVCVLAQRAALHEPLRMQAETDEKTGLLRFEAWRTLAAVEHRRCQEKQRAWSVLFADLDDFKAYNDTYGHLAGDHALATVARVLRTEVRSRDVVGRFGGEEFCVLLPDTRLTEATHIAERVRAAVESCPMPDGSGRTTVSIGVCGVEGLDDLPFIDALATADRGLFEAKTTGRNRVCVAEHARTR